MLDMQPKEQVTSAVDAMLAICDSLGRGDFIPWAQAEAVIGLPRSSPNFRYVIRKFRKKLLENSGIWPLVRIDQGLYLPTDQEQSTECSVNRQRRMFKQAGRGIKELRGVNKWNLSVHEQRKLAMQMDRMVAQRRANRAALKQILQGPKKTETIPQRPMLDPA